MKRIIALLILVLSLAAVPAAGAGTRVPVWEVVEVREETPGSDTDTLEVTTRDRQIYISAQRPVEVSVYTILGQLITKKKISPGTVRLTLGSRGVYILKTETATRRINL